jgi:signal peptidase I
MKNIPVIARVTAIVVLVMAAIAMLSGILTGTLLLYPFCLIFLFAAIGILRGKVWSAYGLALLESSQLILALFLFRDRTDLPPVTLALGVVYGVVLSVLGFLAGRSLEKAGGARGRPFAWIALTAFIVLPWAFVRGFSIPTSSMEDTIKVGDHLLVQTFPTPPPPSFGDIIVFRYPVDHKETFVKRVIGMPGDRIHFARKALYRNGVVLQEPYAVFKTDYPDPYRDDFPSHPPVDPVVGQFPGCADMFAHHVEDGDVVVPRDHYFVLGDNRDNSLDSRYWGFVSTDELIGKPLLIYFSVEPKPADNRNPLEFGHTRWDRFFKKI